MMKINGKMVPVKQVNGKWEPIPDAQLVMTEKGFELREGTPPKEAREEDEE